jgi:hypothetical protein
LLCPAAVRPQQSPLRIVKSGTCPRRVVSSVETPRPARLVIGCDPKQDRPSDRTPMDRQRSFRRKIGQLAEMFHSAKTLV